MRFVAHKFSPPHFSQSNWVEHIVANRDASENSCTVVAFLRKITLAVFFDIEEDWK